MTKNPLTQLEFLAYYCEYLMEIKKKKAIVIGPHPPVQRNRQHCRLNTTTPIYQVFNCRQFFTSQIYIKHIFKCHKPIVYIYI